MSKSIIEKLGITPGPWEYSGGNSVCDFIVNAKNEEVCDIGISSDPDLYLIAAAPEMLESLIFLLSIYENDLCENDLCENDCSFELFNNHKIAVEKATGKTWEEIKGLLNE